MVIGKSISLALKNLTRQRSRTVILIGSIAFGVFLLASINALANGFLDSFLKTYSRLASGHIQITAEEKTDSGRILAVIRDDADLSESIETLFGRDVRIDKRTMTNAALSFNGSGIRQSIAGIDYESDVRDVLELKKGSFENMKRLADGIILGEKMANRLAADIGDRILIELQTLTGQENAEIVTLAAISSDRDFLNSQVAYMNRAYLNQLVGNGKRDCTEVNLYFRDVNGIVGKTDALRMEMRKGFSTVPVGETREDVLIREKNGWVAPYYRVRSIFDLMKDVVRTSEIMNIISLGLSSLMLLLIMAGLFNTFSRIIFERKKEIGTLRAIGMKKREVKRLFLLEALFLTASGIGIGLIAYHLLSLGISLFSFTTDSPFALLLDGGRLNLRLSYTAVILAAASLFIGAAAATSIPAARAAGLTPDQAMRSR